VMDRLLRMLKFRRKIRNRTKGESRVRWVGETIMIDQVKFSMTDLRTAVHGLLQTAKRRMRVDLMRLDEEDGGVDKMPKIDLTQIKDAPGEMGEGFSFLSLKENDWEVDGYQWMIGRLQDYVGRVEVDEDGKKKLILKGRVVKDWIAKLKQFKEELFVLVHLTGGAPARGTEIVSIKSENGADGRVGRGIFCRQGVSVICDNIQQDNRDE